LIGRGLRVAAIKHSPHGFDIDRPGKDTWTLRQTGLTQTLIVGSELLAVMERVDTEPSLSDVIAAHVWPEFDLIVCEGYKQEAHPKIEVAREAVSTELLLRDEDLLAVVADFAPRTTRPVFRPDRADDVAALIVREVLRR
jgi:molybdopterin-guanine dinucleotide biosynthesis protein B